MKKFKVVKEFGYLKKGDVFESNNNLWCMQREEDDSFVRVVFDDTTMESYVTDGYLQEVGTECSCCDTLGKVRDLVDTLTDQYEKDYKNMLDAYNDQEIPTCVKVEAETVYYNLNKLLNKIKSITDEQAS